MGEGREAMVRAKEDHSRKPEESKEQAWREQKPGKSQRHAGEHALCMLGKERLGSRVGPEAERLLGAAGSWP